MRKLIIFGLGSILLASCSDRKDAIQKIDVAPTISFIVAGENKQEITDSVRFYENSVSYYNLKLAINDEKKNLWRLNYKVNKGEAKAYYDGKELTETSLRVDLQEVFLAVSPKTKGLMSMDFTIQDRFENKHTATLNLFVFGNLIPVAVISARKIAINAPLEYILDASASYDQDKNFGGAVAGYVYEIDGRVIETTNKQVNFIFPSVGSYTVKLKVIDNNGEYSKQTELKVDVN